MKILDSFKSGNHRGPLLSTLGVSTAHHVASLPEILSDKTTALNNRIKGKPQAIIVEAIGEKNYGDQDFIVNFRATSNLPVKLSAKGCCSVNGSVVHLLSAGDCTLIARQEGNSEYESARDVSVSFVVKPALLKIKADDKKMIYGSALPAFTATISGMVPGDESIGHLIFPNLAFSKLAPGVYPIHPSGLNSGNYTYEYHPGTLTVVPASLMIKVEDAEVRYGDPLPAFKLAVSGLVNGDTLDSLGAPVYFTPAVTGCAVGSYPVTVFGLSSPNYQIKFIEGYLNVFPAVLTVKADDKSIVYGDSLPEFSVTVTGLVNGDTLGSLGRVSYCTPVNQDSQVGIYPIQPGGFKSANYSYRYIEGKLHIRPSLEKDLKIQCASDGNNSYQVTKEYEKVKKNVVTVTEIPGASKNPIREYKYNNQETVSILSKQLDIPSVDINSCNFEKEALRLIPEPLARKHIVIPVAIRNGYLVVAMANPADIIAIEALSAQTKMGIKPMVAPSADIQKALDRNYKSIGELKNQFIENKAKIEVKTRILDDSIAAAPAVRALDIIVEEAIKNRASDIHIEPEQDKVRIRYRIDGVMHEVSYLPWSAHSPLISRLKILSGMNIADRRPQDGQFSTKSRDKEVDVRVATIATAYGEMGTLRILDKSYAVRPLESIGFSPENLKKYEKMLKSPFGMILVSGPTGSGKTTTLYASVNSMDAEELKIITIEDPIEYHFEGINQIQVNPKGGLTFSNGLRAIMRHDPDVALVGEIRDADTAAVAVQASMTGHLVLASIHANDAIGVLFRLMDFGVEPFLIASALVGVVAQRMVRRLCPHCSREVISSIEYQTEYARELGETRQKFFYGQGCPLCSDTGYLGRTAVMEILYMSDEVRRLFLTKASANQIRAQAMKESMVTLRHDGMLKVKAGITTPDEVMRNVFSVD